jgi:hypothetical protein
MRRKLISLAVLAIALLCAGLVALYPDHVREYRLYLTETRPDLVLPYDEVSQDWSEADLLKRYPDLAFRCYDNRPGEYLGTRSCFVDIQSQNGLPAMSGSFYFDQGRLSDVAINVPWWAHGQTFARLVASNGEPTHSQWWPRDGVRLHGWRLANGSSLFYNRDQPLNPVEWSGIYWKSQRACSKQPCWAAGQQ